MIFTDSHADPGRRAARVHGGEADRLRATTRRSRRQLTAYLNYVPPVKGTKEVLAREDDPEIAENDLIFPDLTKAHNFKTFPPEEEREIDEAFQRAIGA